MCGIAGSINLNGNEINNLNNSINAMSELIEHRGPDGDGKWIHSNRHVGFVHRRLAIIDLSEDATQPMRGINNNIITYNGEIYNYKELQDSLKNDWTFQTNSDTEVILASHAKYGYDCLDYLRGMFSFAIWDEKNQALYCARDRFGIKPFYYCVLGDIFYFASEAKALLPFLNEIRTNKDALAEYLTFQYTIGEKTLFSGIKQLLPGHALVVKNGNIKKWRYWDVKYEIDWDHNSAYFSQYLEELIDDSVNLHLRSDVEVGSYVSGGIDSSLLLNLASIKSSNKIQGFHGRFTDYPGYDESLYAQAAVDRSENKLHILDITAEDFRNNIEKTIYHLDFPVAGPGSFPQYMVSKMASEHLKVVLGGQGGDEIFGGYARYVMAYLEQCLVAAIDGTYNNGNFVVTIESIIPNLGLLREYKPMMKMFWSKGLFDSMDKRYFRLIDRSSDLTNEVDWNQLNLQKVYEDSTTIFNNEKNVEKEAYFDKMTHFDFKCLLPALLQVEDRMSMAHGLESRVPFLDHPLVEFAASVPANIKFKNGNMKYLLKSVFANQLPKIIIDRRDKMGFPVPLREWFSSELENFVRDIFSDMGKKSRPFFNSPEILRNFGNEAKFSRKTWGLLSLELWHQQFHDQANKFRSLVK
jgi:asparagine synthase (glutamine-hydrolysing)